MDDLRAGWSSTANGSLILAVVLAYVAVLLAVARHGDRVRFLPGRNVVRGVSYALSLSVLCTSWTYFGAVGLAMRSGWGFLANSLGPIIALTVMWPLWRRIAVVSKRENVSSVADFIASRYGKSRTLGALIACLAIVGALPYIALQLMALSKATAIIVGVPIAPRGATLMIVVTLAGLAILFGARRPTLTQHNRGLTQVVALESVVKLAALIAVAGLAILLLARAPVSPNWGGLIASPEIDQSFVIATMLCTVTMFTLPRVFHMGFVAFEEVTDLSIGRWLFPAYMGLWAAAIVPIAVAGATLGTFEPDTVVLSLPLLQGGMPIAAFAFLGGISAGSAMVMVETIALSAMISNELILPWLARARWVGAYGKSAGALIVNVRRGAIVAILAASYVFFLGMSGDADLPHLGFASLAASAQLFPALIGGVVWRRGHARGAIWGIAFGTAIWLVTIGAPQIGLGSGRDAAAMHLLFDIGVCLSLAVNAAIFVGMSLLSRESLIDRIQADAFVEDSASVLGGGQRELSGTIGDLRDLLGRFLGPAEAALGLADFDHHRGQPLGDGEPVTPAIARAAERKLAGAIGASSARNVIALALARGEKDAPDVSHILDEAAHAVLFSREIVHAAFNAIDQGISVVDGDLRLVAWNERYVELFQYPPAEVYVGKPLAELMNDSVLRQGMSAQDRAAAVEQRLGPVRRRERQMFERVWPNGMIIRVVGRPLASGEYVTSFSDVTAMKAASHTLAQINEELEARVLERTRELTRANTALAEAKALADRVVTAQNRFVAAASHDLLQPMHAARLYLGAAQESLDDQDRIRQLMIHADLSIEAADRLLKALLNLSRIEVGGVAPEFAPVDLYGLITALKREFDPLADTKGLTLHVARTNCWARSNPDLLRSVLQNLLSNAIRYTSRGRVFVGVRPDKAGLRIEVRDSGPGIAIEARELIFREFVRLPETSGVSGSGLGLAIASRICTALDHTLAVRSEQGRGSVFSIALPRAEPFAAPHAAGTRQGALNGLAVLCVEDKFEVLHAQRLLLEHWGANVASAQTYEEAILQTESFDVLIADYHLGPGPDGLDLLERMARTARHRLLLTADITDSVRERADALGVTVLRKPVTPASLRAFLTHAAKAGRTATIEVV